MNILFIASFRITPNSGGVQRVTETLAREFSKSGHLVYYLSFSKGEEEIIKGINQYYLPKGEDYNNLENSVFLKKILIDHKIDIIINQIGFNLKALYFIKKNIHSNVKILTVHHNCLKCLNDQYHDIYISTLKKKGVDKLFDNKWGWYFLRKLHKFRFGKVIKETIVLSDKVVLLSDKFIPDIGFYMPNFNRSKIMAIPNPNPYSGVNASSLIKENSLLYVGRLDYGQKRVDRLIEVWYRLYKKFPDWNFHIVGDGSMRSELVKMVLEKDIKRIYFHGFKDPKPFYEKAKIFGLTSSFEGFGMVLVEAQTYGVVPITNRSFSSIDEIIDNGNTGLIMGEYNLENYLSELQKLMNSPQILEAMSKNAIRNVEKFSSKRIAHQWINLFKNL